MKDNQVDTILDDSLRYLISELSCTHEVKKRAVAVILSYVNDAYFNDHNGKFNDMCEMIDMYTRIQAEKNVRKFPFPPMHMN